MEKTNFELFMETVNTLKYSQGFYSRIANQLANMDSTELESTKTYFNGLDQKFNDTLDVIMFLEC